MQEDIKIGRIKKEVESSLNLTLTSNINIYISSPILDSICKKFPSDYLRLLNLIKKIISKPKMVSYQNQSLFFVKGIRKDGRGKINQILVEIRHLGKPKRWYFARIGKANEDLLQNGFIEMRR